MSELLFSEFFNQKLKERRITLPQLAEMSGISLKHLEQFAHGRFEHLPPTPYLRGYFNRLGSILNFDPTEWWERVRKSEMVQRSGKGDMLPQNRFGVRQSRAFVIIGAILTLIVLYFGFRATKIIGKPILSVSDPSADTTRVDQSHVFVAGNMKNGDQVLINGEQVSTDPDGAFHEDVSLQPGMNNIDITAKKTLGRTTTITKQVYYEASPIQILMPEGSAATTTNSQPSASSSSSTAPAP